MSASPHASGAAGIRYNGSLLGYPEDAAEVELVPHHNPIYVDVFGGTRGTPGDFQILAEEAFVSASLVHWDWAVLNAALSASRAGASPGILPPAGTILGRNGFLKSLNIPSDLDGVPWTFPFALLISPTRFSPSTVRGLVPVTFHCIGYKMDADSSAGAVLYTH